MFKTVKIVYPTFLHCCKYTTNVFWRNLFEELAYGNTPYGMYFYRRSLCSNSKGREFSYSFDGTESEKLYKDLYVLIGDSGVISDHEHTQRRLRFYSMDDTEDMHYTCWKNIKRKNIREMLLDKFVIKSKDEYELTMAQSKRLLETIQIALIFKTITSEDITMENGNITAIHGVEVYKGGFTAVTVYENLGESQGLTEAKGGKKLAECWALFLKNLSKNS